MRFAVDAYVNFARRAPWQEAACSSLTELFAPEIHKKRLENWPQHYPWIEPEGYAYFRKRLSEARRDVEHGLQVTLDYFKTREEQERALDILQFKLDVLWSMLDSMQINYGHRRNHGMPEYRDHSRTTQCSNFSATSAFSGSRRSRDSCCSTRRAWSSCRAAPAKS